MSLFCRVWIAKVKQNDYKAEHSFIFVKIAITKD